MERGELEFLISDFLPRGVTFIGGLPGAGKTWFALSLVKALVTGVPFLGRYAVPARVPVLYLIPEVGERAFRSRLERCGLLLREITSYAAL
jgi:RecA-family ATPase